MARRIHSEVLAEFDSLVTGGMPVAEAGRRVGISEKSARRRVGVTCDAAHQARVATMSLVWAWAKVQPCVANGCLRAAEVPTRGVCHAHYKRLRAHGRYEGFAPAVGDRACRSCGVLRPLVQFSSQSTGPGGRRADCKPCAARIAREGGRRNRLRKYGLTQAAYDELSERQGGVCAICGAPPAEGSQSGLLAVDHCHATRRVRGLLCRGCNVALGFMRDDPARLEAAAAYLRRNA